MSEISNIVKVEIVAGTQSITRQEFGLPLIFGNHSRFLEDYKVYTEMDQVSEDFQTTDEEYKKALAIFSQTPRPTQLIIGRNLGHLKQKVNIAIDTAEAGDYSVLINGNEYTYTALITDAKADIVDGLLVAIATGSEPVTTTDNGDDFDIEADETGIGFSIAKGEKADNMTLTESKANVAIDTVTIGETYSIKINNHLYSYLAQSGDVAADIVDELISAITGHEEVILTDNGDDFDIEQLREGEPFYINLWENATDMTLTQSSRINRNFATEIARFQQINNSWYFLLPTGYVNQDIKDLAAYIETQIKIMGILTSDIDVKSTSTTDIVSFLESKNYNRSFVVYTDATSNYIESAIVGVMAPKDPGSATWFGKNLNGVSSDELTATEINNLQNKNCNYYLDVANRDTYFNGRMVSGEFADIIRGIDWIQSNLEEDVFILIVDNEKIPYTQNGINMVIGTIRNVLRKAVNMGILSNDIAFTVSAPDIADISSADKASRTLRNVYFSATFAGAIHKIDKIEGKISY